MEVCISPVLIEVRTQVATSTVKFDFNGIVILRTFTLELFRK